MKKDYTIEKFKNDETANKITALILVPVISVVLGILAIISL